MSKKFQWDQRDFDGDGSAYIVAKSECPNREEVPGFIQKADGLHPDVLIPDEQGDCLCVDIVEEGWCKYQVRSDWSNIDGPAGGYVVELGSHNTPHKGWFPVWVVRIGEWY